jgi:hypothetical protein
MLKSMMQELVMFKSQKEIELLCRKAFQAQGNVKVYKDDKLIIPTINEWEKILLGIRIGSYEVTAYNEKIKDRLVNEVSITLKSRLRSKIRINHLMSENQI